MPKSETRIGRIAEQIQRDLAELIRTELKDPRVGLITLTGVELSSDYHHAKVFFTTLGGASAVSSALEGLVHAAGFLRSELARSLRLRVVPELHFVYDESIERGDRLNRLINEAIAKSAGSGDES